MVKSAIRAAKSSTTSLSVPDPPAIKAVKIVIPGPREYRVKGAEIAVLAGVLATAHHDQVVFGRPDPLVISVDHSTRHHGIINKRGGQSNSQNIHDRQVDLAEHDIAVICLRLSHLQPPDGATGQGHAGENAGAEGAGHHLAANNQPPPFRAVPTKCRRLSVTPRGCRCPATPAPAVRGLGVPGLHTGRGTGSGGFPPVPRGPSGRCGRRSWRGSARPA